MTRAPQAEAPVRLTIRAKPGAKHCRILRVQGLTLEVSLTARPVDNAANEQLIELLATTLSVRKSAVTLVLGQTSRNKVLEITSLSATEVATRLAKIGV
jgi:uncharacterized protein YggU (UPF0235/DUF167 family)